MQNTLYEMLGWMHHKLVSRVPGEISTSEMQMIPLRQKEELLKSLFIRVKEESK